MTTGTWENVGKNETCTPRRLWNNRPSSPRDVSGSELLIKALAHDLRAPLRNMRHLSRTLAEQFTGATATSTGAELMRLNSLVEKTSCMVDDLLLLERAGRSFDPGQPTHLAELVRDAVDLGWTRSDMAVQVSGEPAAFVTARAELALVMRNVIGNAMRHHDRAQGRIDVIVSRCSPDIVEFLVRDDGPGLPQDMLDWLMVGSNQPHRTSPISLGLMLAVTMVQRYTGETSAQSGYLAGRGTEFCWTWPARDL